MKVSWKVVSKVSYLYLKVAHVENLPVTTEWPWLSFCVVFKNLLFLRLRAIYTWHIEIGKYVFLIATLVNVFKISWDCGRNCRVQVGMSLGGPLREILDPPLQPGTTKWHAVMKRLRTTCRLTVLTNDDLFIPTYKFRLRKRSLNSG